MCMSEAAMDFVRALPPCVTHLRLSFEDTEDPYINITKLLKKLQERCPDIRVLIFHRARLKAKDCSYSIVHLCESLLTNMRVLVMHYCKLKKHLMIYNKDTVTSKIEVLDVTGSASLIKVPYDDYNLYFRPLFRDVPRLKKVHFSEMYENDEIFSEDPSKISHLELLNLERNFVGPKTFRAIQKYGSNLIELYICYTVLNDNDLIFEDAVDILPQLKKICLRATPVTFRGIHSLMESCPSVQHIHVGSYQIENSQAVGYHLCNSERIHVVQKNDFCYHFSEIDYICMYKV